MNRLLLPAFLLVAVSAAWSWGRGEAGLGIVVKPLTQPDGAVEVPRSGAVVPPVFGISGWAVDPTAGTGKGPGVNGVEIWDGGCGSGTKLGDAETGVTRGDIIKGLGLDETYLPAGFRFKVRALPAGEHRIVACARTASSSDPLAITVDVSVSNDYIEIFSPAPGTSVSAPFSVSGFAVRFGSARPPGVRLVRIVRDSCDERDARAEAQYGLPREDSRNYLGLGEEYANMGFEAQVAALDTGEQTIKLCALSEAGEYSERSLTVQAAGPGQRVGIFRPEPNENVPAVARIIGYALDFSGGESNGPGVDRVEVRDRSCRGKKLADAVYGEPRVEVKNFLGLDSSYTNIGFLADLADLSAGEHKLVVCAVSRVHANVFASSVNVTVTR